MELKDFYTFPAIVSYDDDGIGIEFPDIAGCFSCVELDGEDIPHKIMHNAQEALALHLYNMEDDGDTIPEPSDILSIAHEPNQAVVLVDVSMPPVRERMRNKSINKMCTVPAWLVKEAETHHFSFSQILQEGLMEKLGITRTNKRKSLRR